MCYLFENFEKKQEAKKWASNLIRLKQEDYLSHLKNIWK